MTKPTFDIDAAIKALREGKDLSGKDGILTPLIKQLTEAAMQAELEEHLTSEDKPNRKNGRTSKTMKSPATSNWRHRAIGLVPSSLRSSRSTRRTLPMNWSAR